MLQSFRHHFSYQQGNVAAGTKNVFDGMLLGLNEQKDKRRRKKAAYKFWYDDHKADVHAEMDRRGVNSIGQLNSVAAALFAAAPSEEQEIYEARGRAETEQETAVTERVANAKPHLTREEKEK